MAWVGLRSAAAMDTSPQQLAGHVEVASGLTAAGVMLSVPTQALMAEYPAFAAFTRGPVRVTTTDAFDELSILAERAADDSNEVGDAIATDELAALRGVRAHRDRTAFTELSVARARPAVTVTDHVVGRDRADVDARVLRDHGASAATVAELLARIQPLRSDAATCGASTSRDELGAGALHARLRGVDPTPLVAAAERASASRAQRQLLARIHRVLARRSPALVGVPCRPAAGAVDEMHVSYAHIAEESVLRVLTGVFPNGDHGRQLAHFCGALAGHRHGDVISVFTLVVGAFEPLRFRIAVDVSMA